MNISPEFRLGEEFPFEENRHFEFKEIKGSNPVDSIVNTADEYAVAFMNSEGGDIFWGIRNHDRVIVGVVLNAEQRDILRRLVFEKVQAIQPQIDPTRFRLAIHPAIGSTSNASFVVQLSVPDVQSPNPFYTSGHEVFVRVDGARKRLSGPQLTDWIQCRLSKANRDDCIQNSWELQKIAESALRSDAFDRASETLTKILQDHPNSPEATTIRSLVSYARANGGHDKFRGRINECRPTDAKGLKSFLQSMETIAGSYNSSPAEKKSAVDTIFGPGTFESPVLTLQGVLNCLTQLEAARKKALGEI